VNPAKDHAEGPALAGTRDLREELLAALEDVPPVGPVAMRVLEVMNNPSASAADLARVVSRDQGLAAKLLRTSNSPIVAPTEPITSLSQAVVTLGMRTVRNIVLYHALPVGKSGGKWSETEAHIWTHAVGSALGSRFIAMETGKVDPELAFMGGLFHDLGRILLLQLRPKTYEALVRAAAPGLPARDAEKELGADHAEIGGAMLERWGMGAELASVALHHHDDPATLDPLTLVVVAAESLLVEDGVEPCAAHAAAAERAGLVESRRAGLRERLQGALHKEQEFFRLSG
jgi:HD-like signal output (HDOD) protein